MIRIRRLSREIAPNEAATPRVAVRWAVPHVVRIAEARYARSAAVDTSQSFHATIVGSSAQLLWRPVGK